MVTVADITHDDAVVADPRGEPDDAPALVIENLFESIPHSEPHKTPESSAGVCDGTTDSQLVKPQFRVYCPMDCAARGHSSRGLASRVMAELHLMLDAQTPLVRWLRAQMRQRHVQSGRQLGQVAKVASDTASRILRGEPIGPAVLAKLADWSGESFDELRRLEAQSRRQKPAPTEGAEGEEFDERDLLLDEMGELTPEAIASIRSYIRFLREEQKRKGG